MDRIAVLASGAGSTLAWLIEAVERGTLAGRIVRVITDRPDTGAAYHAETAAIPHSMVKRHKKEPKKSAPIELSLETGHSNISSRILEIVEGEVDLIVCAGFLSILEEPLLGRFTGRIINTHPALLPRFGGMGMYGIHVHKAVLAAGEKMSGCSLHFVDPGVDTGQLIDQVRVPVFPSDTPETLARRVQREEKPLLVRTINRLLSALSSGSSPGAKERLRIALIGNGGREHALAWKMLRDPRCDLLLALPGNGGIAGLPGSLQAQLPEDFSALRRLLERHQINLVVIGPEHPLTEGLADKLRDAGFPLFGPGASGAHLEGSKMFAKDFMNRHSVATAAYASFRKGEEQAVLAFAEQLSWQVAVKADGLAAGKGVILCRTPREVEDALNCCFSGSFGLAGEGVVIEELLEGPEVSIFVIHEGIDSVLLPSAADYKRAFDGDQGPNTGGMGSVAPAPHFTEDVRRAFTSTILAPTLKGLREEGIEWRGVLFFGLILTKDGPKLLEYNVRFGDPETQSLMLLLPDDFASLLSSCSKGSPDFANAANSRWESPSGNHACSVVAVAEGYPGPYEKGKEIKMDTQETVGRVCFIAGAQRQGAKLLTSGGRVLSSSCSAATAGEARKGAYAGIASIRFEGMRYRSDIGL
jgi:phosphoribosylamine---glycine ligase